MQFSSLLQRQSRMQKIINTSTKALQSILTHNQALEIPLIYNTTDDSFQHSSKPAHASLLPHHTWNSALYKRVSPPVLYRAQIKIALFYHRSYNYAVLTNNKRCMTRKLSDTRICEDRNLQRGRCFVLGDIFPSFLGQDHKSCSVVNLIF